MNEESSLHAEEARRTHRIQAGTHELGPSPAELRREPDDPRPRTIGIATDAMRTALKRNVFVPAMKEPGSVVLKTATQKARKAANTRSFAPGTIKSRTNRMMPVPGAGGMRET